MIDTNDIESARMQLRNKQPPRIVITHDEKFNRTLLEHGGFEVLLLNVAEKASVLLSPRKPSLFLNDVMLRIASRKNISIGFDLAQLKPLSLEQKAQALARIFVLVSLARKAKTRIVVLNSPNNYSAQSLLLALGASTQQAAQVQFLNS